MKKIILSFIVSLTMIFGSLSSVMAQPVNPIAPGKVRDEIKNIRQDARQQIQETKQNVRGEIKQNRDAMQQNLESKRAEAKNLMENKREDFKNKIETKREEVKSKIEAKKGELKDHLVKIKDERKKQIVEKIYDQVNELNKRRLDHFSAVLEKLEKILDRISGRADKAEVNGHDISAVKTAITEATNAIAASRTAIQNQTGKIYAPTISSESALKADVGEIRKTLHSDLTVIQETVKTSQEAVKKAATTLAQIPKVDELEVATSTISETTTTQPVQQ
ncbi:apolipoprotein A1/A4/E family protein [Candidatus Wolfebacteria bacterium]|nr:apolipoprotein A1/A4/E family protein [Candidatus Wolfebacteria bacterium]